MEQFVVHPLAIDGSVAIVKAENEEFKVELRVQRKDGRTIQRDDAQLAYTQMITALPQRTRYGR